MNNKAITFKKKLSVAEYIAIVNNIASNYYNENGEYQPHIGILNAMRIFYNVCVTEDMFDLPHNIVDASEVEKLANDDEFIHSFNSAIESDGNVQLNFANAYIDAIAIVESKNDMITNAIMPVKNMIIDMIQNFSSYLTEENMNIISKISEGISNGNITADSIIEAYGKSQGFKDAAIKKVE